MIAAVSAIDEFDFGGSPRFGSETTEDEGAFGGDGIDLACHGETFPKGCKEGANADGDERNKEDRDADFEPDGNGTNGGFDAIHGDGLIGVTKDDLVHKGDADRPTDGIPRDAEEHQADGLLVKSTWDGFPGPEELFIEVKFLLNALGFFWEEHREVCRIGVKGGKERPPSVGQTAVAGD